VLESAPTPRRGRPARRLVAAKEHRVG
jgi:hypothetical protein